MVANSVTYKNRIVVSGKIRIIICGKLCIVTYLDPLTVAANKKFHFGCTNVVQSYRFRFAIVLHTVLQYHFVSFRFLLYRGKRMKI